MTNFQREGASSNTDVGERFRADVREFCLSEKGWNLEPDYPVDISQTKSRKFSLGSYDPPMLVTCRAHTWTKSDNMPSAKLTNWGEAMNYLRIAPPKYHKIFVAQKSLRKSDGESLLAYFIRNRDHLIPDGVELWEFDTSSGAVEILKSAK